MDEKLVLLDVESKGNHGDKGQDKSGYITEKKRKSLLLKHSTIIYYSWYNPGMEQNNKKDPSTSSATNNNKHLLYAGLAIIVVIAIALIVPHLHKAAPAAMPAAATPTVQAAAAAPSSSAATSSAFPSSWTAMLNEYSGRVVIFDSACAATPNTQVQGLGTRIALVNNSAVSHTVIFGNDTGYTIPAYHYKTVLIENSSVINISCDSVQKAASITVK